MKQIQTLFVILLITCSSTSIIVAQDLFPSFEIFNRVLLVKYADTIDPDVKTEVFGLFKGLTNKIEGLEWVHIADLTQSSHGFEQAITLTFKTKAGLEAYEAHPDHLRIQEIAGGIVTDFASYEFWDRIE